MNSTDLYGTELDNYINYLCRNGNPDLINTLGMIGVLYYNTQSFHQTGFTNYDFTGIQKVLISQFLKNTGSDHIAKRFENIFDYYVNMFIKDYQISIDITTDPFQQNLFTLNTGFFKKFREEIDFSYLKELEKLFKKFLQSSVIDHYYSENVFNNKSFQNLVLWYLLDKTKPVDLWSPGVKDILYLTITGVQGKENRWVTGEQKTTHYFHYINSLTGENTTLYKFRKCYGEKRKLEYWERILCRILLPYTIWWAKNCLDYREIKFVNDLNKIREEKTGKKVRGRICCIFCNDFCSTREDIEDFAANGWHKTVDNLVVGEKYNIYRRYNILLQDKENYMLYLITRVGIKNIMMNSFHKLRNGDILEFRNCSVVPGNSDSLYLKKLSDIFDGIPIHEIIVGNEDIIRVEKQ